MTNAIQVNQSTVVGGTGTQSYTVTTAGNYTLSFKSFIPYLAAGSAPQTANPSAASVDITCVADSGGSLNNTWFSFGTAGDLYPYYVWYNINSAGTDPAVSGKIGIQVAAATNATASTIASATRAAIAAATSLVTVSGGTTHCIITNNSVGSNTAAANGTASPGFSYSNTAGSYGTPAISGLGIVLQQNTTVLARFGFPGPTQPIMGGSVVVSASANDTLSVVLSSQSSADSVLNSVKTIINLYQGIGA